MTRKTIILAALITLGGLTLQSPAAVAHEGAQFAEVSARVECPAEPCSFADTQVVISFRETGLGSFESVFYTARVVARATYGCQNRGGHFAASKKFHTVVVGGSTSGFSFTSDASGEVDGTFRRKEIDAVDPPFDFAERCPTGHRLARQSVTYFLLRLVDQTHGISHEIPGEFTYTLS